MNFFSPYVYIKANLEHLFLPGHKEWKLIVTDGFTVLSEGLGNEDKVSFMGLTVQCRN